MADLKIYAETLEDSAKEQIDKMSSSDAYNDSTIRIMPDCHAGKGCTIGTVIKYTDKVVPNTVGVDIGCLDCDTEVLTPYGWIRIADYDGQEIMQYNPSSDRGMFSKPTAFIKKTCDFFYHFKNSKGLDQMVSEEHNMLVYSGNKKCGRKYNLRHPDFFFDKDNLSKGYYSFNTCFNVVSDGVDIPDELIRIDVMVQADGRVRRHDMYNSVELHFRKERKIERAEKLLTDAGIEYNKYVIKDGSTYMSFRAPTYIDKDLRKYFKASYSQLKIVAEECLKWDGYDSHRSFYTSTDKGNIDVVQYAFIATNVRASLYCVHDKRGDNRKDCYYVTPTHNKYVGYSDKPTKVQSIDGFKYCFTTQLGYFLCRRNGYTFMTGNCGMHVTNLGKTKIDFDSLDNFIRTNIPAGRNVHNKLNVYADFASYYGSYDYRTNGVSDWNYIQRSLGTLGGGNHFIEIDEDDDGNYYLVIHTGSRHLGVETCNYWQNVAIRDCQVSNAKRREIINFLKENHREKEIESALKNLPSVKIDNDLAYLQGENLKNYLFDMRRCQDWAKANREIIASKIVHFLKPLRTTDSFHTIHNYVDTINGIIRKGAVSADNGERLIIPINMRDGSLICVGKGNDGWLRSAPHGAGRIMSRNAAKSAISLEDYKKSMSGIFTTSVCNETIDESPMVYKSMDEIIRCVEPTVTIEKVIKPVYNFKAKD